MSQPLSKSPAAWMISHPQINAGASFLSAVEATAPGWASTPLRPDEAQASGKYPSDSEIEDSLRAWKLIKTKLDEVQHGWDNMEDGVRPIADAAVSAIHRLSLAAETDRLSLIKSQIQNEVVFMHGFLKDTQISGEQKIALELHLARLSRIV